MSHDVEVTPTSDGWVAVCRRNKVQHWASNPYETRTGAEEAGRFHARDDTGEFHYPKTDTGAGP